MATIPIEVIVQDAEAPIVPSEDGTNTNTNTEAAVAVPDTGGSGSNIFTGSASSIILPAILLVLAIGSIVAILIHKYHKQKKDKTSKKEKLAVAASSTIAVLAATVLVSNLILPATKAATNDITDGITLAEDKVSIMVTRDGGVAEASIESTATITSTSDFGYKVLLSMAEGVETNYLYLNGDVDSEYYIASVEAENEEEVELADNTWGYALEEGSSYNAVPLLDSAATVAQGDEAVEDEGMGVYYGVKISNDLPAGTYSGGDMEYSLFPVEPIGTISYLQDFAAMSTEFKTTVLNSMVEDQQYYLKDNRDSKTYRIAKLKDGKLWMTQNLDLQKEDLLAGVILNNDNTDYPASEFTLSDSQINSDTSWGDSSIENLVNAVHIYDIAGDGHSYYNCLEPGQFGGCQSYDSDPIPSSELGNLYNWYTATAGTGTLYMNESNQASGSICPAGWKLPTSSESGVATDFSALLYGYGMLQNPASDELIADRALSLFSGPVFLVRSGYFYGNYNSAGLYGKYWSSVSTGENARAYALGISWNSVVPWDTMFKAAGSSVRCLLR